MWQHVNASPPPDFVVWVRGIRTGWARAIGCGVSLPHFLCFSSIRYPPLKDHVRIVGPASVLRVIFATCGARYQIYRDSSTSRMGMRLASVPVSRPLAQSGHRLNCLPTWSVLCVTHVMSSNPPSMAATFAHACRPLFSTHAPPTDTAVRSVPVSACRLLVVTKLTEGAVFVGGCEADGGSA